MKKGYINFCSRKLFTEDIDNTELKILDKTTLTDIKDIIRKFASDKSFAPREESNVVYDSDFGDIDIDKDVAPLFEYDFEQAYDDSVSDVTSSDVIAE